MVVRIGAAVGLLVIDSVGLDLQLETVCDCQGTLLLADERCFALFSYGSVPDIDRYPSRLFGGTPSTLVATPRAIVPFSLPTVTDNILILLRR